MDKDPLADATKQTKVGCLDPDDVLDDHEEVVLGQVIKRLNVKQCELRMYFQDKDKCRSGWVRKDRFRSILNQYGVPIGDDEYKIVVKRFSRGKELEVCYKEFDDYIKNFN